jgi:hypothetical protein
MAFQRHCGHGDGRTFSEPLFQLIIVRLVFGQSEPPAIIKDHDADMIRVLEGRGAALERGIIEVPLRRSDLPNELRKQAHLILSDCSSDVFDGLA